MTTLSELNKLSKSIQEFAEENAPTVKETYLRIKDWPAKALAGYARKVGIPDEYVNPIKRDSDSLISEILSHLYGDDWEYELVKSGVL